MRALAVLAAAVSLGCALGCSESHHVLVPSTVGALDVSIVADPAARDSVGVTVDCAGTMFEARTDSGGAARLDSLPPGPATVTLHGLEPGYEIDPTSHNPAHVTIVAGTGSSVAFLLRPDPLFGYDLNDTPLHTVNRLQLVHNVRAPAAYQDLLTADFRFHFSADTDPTLVVQYGDNWGKADEMQYAVHLFDGFINSFNQFVPGASLISFIFNGIAFTDDPYHPDSTGYYMRGSAPNLNGFVNVPLPGDPSVYNVGAPHAFYVVRGDAAILDPGQPATADRWYIRRWDDLATVPPGGTAFVAPQSVFPTSWGNLKARYR